MNPEVTNYYNDLASTYDESRFGNTYGKFIQDQEQLILEHSFIVRKKYHKQLLNLKE